MRSISIAVLMVLSLLASSDAVVADGGYAVVVSGEASADPEWKEVVEVLVAKHQARVLTYKQQVEEALPTLRQEMPRFVCFVARPSEASREFVGQVNRLTRRLNDDPYTDVLWGILTGYDAQNALRIARQKEPLVIRRVAAGTEIELAACEEGQWYCELTPGKLVRKERGKTPQVLKVPVDTTEELVDLLNTYRPQLLVTSGHATERDWQIGYRYRNGQFRSQAGQLFGLDTQGRRFPVQSENPKVYLPVGNCLMGHIDGPDAMALAYMNSAGVCQMAGYTVPTWYGYAGWGLLDYFLEQPGRFTLAEAFFANQQALIHRLATHFPGLETADLKAIRPDAQLPPAARAAGLTWQDARGLLYDRDTLAFYGDPAWEARMAPGPLAWEQTLTVADGKYCFEVRPLVGERSFRAHNTNGSQRGGRPFVQLFPARIQAERVEILEGADLHPVVTSKFLLLPNPGECKPDAKYRVVFTVSPEQKAKPSGLSRSR